MAETRKPHPVNKSRLVRKFGVISRGTDATLDDAVRRMDLLLCDEYKYDDPLTHQHLLRGRFKVEALESRGKGSWSYRIFFGSGNNDRGGLSKDSSKTECVAVLQAGLARSNIGAGTPYLIHCYDYPRASAVAFMDLEQVVDMLCWSGAEPFRVLSGSLPFDASCASQVPDVQPRPPPPTDGGPSGVRRARRLPRAAQLDDSVLRKVLNMQLAVTWASLQGSREPFGTNDTFSHLALSCAAISFNRALRYSVSHPESEIHSIFRTSHDVHDRLLQSVVKMWSATSDCISQHAKVMEGAIDAFGRDRVRSALIREAHIVDVDKFFVSASQQWKFMFELMSGEDPATKPAENAEHAGGGTSEEPIPPRSHTHYVLDRKEDLARLRKVMEELRNAPEKNTANDLPELSRRFAALMSSDGSRRSES